MKKYRIIKAPKNSLKRKNVKPVICYPNKNLNNSNFSIYKKARKYLKVINQIIIPPRDAKCFKVKEGQFFRIECIEGSQVGDLNLFQFNNINEKFYSGKTRALHGTHLSIGDQMWSCLPYFRPLATITWDTLNWYGIDNDGGSVHDVIGTRCDPYTAKLLKDSDYHYCCHSNLTRALAKLKNMKIKEAENFIHDVLNVFMCTGFTKDTHQYFMKASPARAGDYIEFFAETNLLGILSSCPGGDCGSEHSSDNSKCYPLKISILSAPSKYLKGRLKSLVSTYNKKHGL